MKEVLFDIKYRCFNGSEIYEIIIQEEVEKEQVEEKIDKMFKSKNVVAVDVMKHGERDAIFHHSVWSGTFVGDKRVSSKYPKWYHIINDCNNRELNILELLNSIE